MARIRTPSLGETRCHSRTPPCAIDLNPGYEFAGLDFGDPLRHLGSALIDQNRHADADPILRRYLDVYRERAAAGAT